MLLSFNAASGLCSQSPCLGVVYKLIAPLRIPAQQAFAVLSSGLAPVSFPVSLAPKRRAVGAGLFRLGVHLAQLAVELTKFGICADDPLGRRARPAAAKTRPYPPGDGRSWQCRHVLRDRNGARLRLGCRSGVGHCRDLPRRTGCKWPGNLFRHGQGLC